MTGPTSHRPARRLVRAGHRAPVRLPRPVLTPPRVRRRPSTRPLWAVLVTILLLGTVLAGRLGQLQLAEHEELAQQAAQVSTREIITPALRGRILAADGTPLVVNSPTSVVTLDPELLLADEDEARTLVDRVAQALRLPAEDLWGRTRLCGTEGAPPVPACFSGSPYQPVPIAYDVDPVAALAVLERPEEFPGVHVTSRAVRTYPAPGGINAAHLVGYLGRPTQEEVEASDGRIGADGTLGRAGLETTYDEALRGTPGTTVVTVDPRGIVTGERSRTDPVQGADVRTHLDVQVQAAVEEALLDAVRAARRGGEPATSGAAVVLRPDDGAVLAAASFPTYDPGIWTSGVSQHEYDRLLDPARGQPLVSRLVGDTFPPASTFKVVSLPAAVQTGVDPEGTYPCPGEVTIAGQVFTNYQSEDHGELDLPGVLEVSCDTSFYTWAYDAWSDLGGLAQTSDADDRFLAVARGFGLGQRTGVDLPGEVAGHLPSREWKREYWEATREETCAAAESGYPDVEDEERREFLEQLARENCVDGWQWRPGDAANFSIGQGDVASTPLQIAVVYAAIANGGRLWAPTVADALVRPDGTVAEQVEPVSTGSVSLSDTVLSVVREGLEDVVTDGTAAASFAGWPHADYPLAGKTGSAESFGQEATSWFASYGPTTDPEYVVVVVVEEGGLGATTATPAGRAIWETLRARDSTG
ncbi:penicillin-binding protein 2 [Ornithinimicrobium sufpigmenti]|uniref:penicillin-binding protein 2 n=1 Tax=Ornithinimicrobium sufpigmenti TaxID=2508882 RepID=UPI0010363111|nr:MULTISPECIES: penicillin-binding protein 2 [unclassified Ornithinimicrobium]